MILKRYQGTHSPTVDFWFFKEGLVETSDISELIFYLLIRQDFPDAPSPIKTKKKNTTIWATQNVS